MKIRTLCLVAFVYTLQFAHAADYYTVSTGVWENDLIWSSTPDGTGEEWSSFKIKNGDQVIIRHNVEINLNTNLIISDKVDVIIHDATLKLTGKLKLVNEASSIRLISKNSFIKFPENELPDPVPVPIPPSDNEKIWISNKIVWSSRNGDLQGPLLITYSTITPIVLSKFEVSKTAKGLFLSWSTASEKNFDYFSVERSHDAKNYVPIGTIKGSGWSQTRQDYEFKDENPLPGINYYRLKAVDYDGYTEYFPPVSAYNENTNILISTVARDKVLDVYSNVQAKAQLVNLHGTTIELQDVVHGSNRLALPSWLTKGIYVLVITDERKTVGKEKIFVD